MGIVLLFTLVEILFISIARGCWGNDCDYWEDDRYQSNDGWDYGYPEWDWALTDQERNAFIDYDLLEDVSQEVIPDTILKISYGGRLVETGELIKTADISQDPDLEWYCDPYQKYTAIAAEVGALAANKGNQYLRWRVNNICDCNLKTGKTVAHYRVPSPPPGTGTIKLLFLIFETPDEKSSSELQKGLEGTLQGSTGRIDFDTSEMIKKYGRPLAGNFLTVTNDLIQSDLLKPATKLPLGDETDVVHGLESVL